ncbi:hypothetical protein D3C72_501230 [compost metagenome]
MENLLTNAGWLDGASGWTASPAGLTVTVDETARGAPGRAALVAKGNSTSSGQSFLITSTSASRANVNGAAMVEVSACMAAFVAGGAVMPTARLVFFDAAGGVLAAYGLQVSAPQLPQWGVAQLGLPDTYYRVRARLPRPGAAVKAVLEAGGVASAAGQSVEAVLLKPLIAAAPPLGHPLLWSPGAHTSPDLQLPAWPGALREFETGAGWEPKPGLIEFDAGSGRPRSRTVAADPARKLSGRVRCDVVQRAMLEDFARTARKFWFVEPGSDRLCVASWTADGAPRLAETRGALHFMEVSLWLETA